MKSDAIFYQLFRQEPSAYFELIGAPPGAAAGYDFTSVELKQVARRIDGVFLPKRQGPPVHFVEVFHYKTTTAYSNLFAKVFLWLEANNPGQDWQACVIFASRDLEPVSLTPYRSLLEGGQVRRVFLDELPEPAEDQVGLGILDVIAAPSQRAIAKARTWLRRVDRSPRPLVHRRALIELIEVVVLSRFPKLTRKEMEEMLELTDLRKTKVFQELFEEGLEKGRVEGIEKGRVEGIEKGRLEGIEKAREEFALRLLARKHTAAEVAELTGLAVAEVKRLQRKRKR